MDKTLFESLKQSLNRDFPLDVNLTTTGIPLFEKEGLGEI